MTSVLQLQNDYVLLGFSRTGKLVCLKEGKGECADAMAQPSEKEAFRTCALFGFMRLLALPAVAEPLFVSFRWFGPSLAPSRSVDALRHRRPAALPLALGVRAVRPVGPCRSLSKRPL